jgi:hypothetical protein
MSAPEPMPSARRHPIPGMTKPATTSPAQPPEPEPLATGKGVTDQRADDRPLASAAGGSGSDSVGARPRHPAETTDGRRQWPGTAAGSDPEGARSRHPAETVDGRRQWPGTAAGSDPEGPRSHHPAETADGRRRWPGTAAGSDLEGPRSRHPAETTDSRRQWPATDYAATRLANFRIPVALLDRYRHLVREAEDRDPRLRRPSVTEVVIGLLQEGPATPEEVAELIRRKRAAEHGLES